ncbi:Hypothetical protein PBC10988_8680 [Planctomycetales bacterium 10988]|nr:Hypothetical protein PBC10988_8680 [Planctomycetales bacterium 10988]
MHVLTALRKVRKMSGHEIRTRLISRYRTNYEKVLFEYRSFLPRRPVSPAAKDLVERAQLFLPGSQPSQRAELLSKYPDLHRRWKAQADPLAEKFSQGKLPLFTKEMPIPQGQPIDWHCDPFTNFSWKKTAYAPKLPLYDLPNDTDVKYIWELGRHQWLAQLAQAEFWEDRLGVDSNGLDIWLHWQRENPFRGGVHWTSGLEVAMRVISWLWMSALWGEQNGWSPTHAAELDQSLGEHGQYLYHHLSYYSSPYNHLIGEATALVLLGWWLKAHPHAKHWRRRGWKVLETAAPRQFYAEGFSVEQATGYHFYTLGFLLLAYKIQQLEGQTSPWLAKLIEQTASAGAALDTPDHRWPMMGDVDSARTLPVPRRDYWDFRSILNLASCLLDTPVMNISAEESDAEVYWLQGCDGVKKLEALAQAAKDDTYASQHYWPEAGYTIASSPEEGDWLLFDAGPLADGVHADATPSVAHGHADLFQLLLYRNRSPILIDSGMPTYAGDRSKLDHFRSPAAHNTLEVLDQPIAQSPSRLAWSHEEQNRGLKANLSEDLWISQGKLQFISGDELTRTVIFWKGLGLWILDQLEATQPRKLRWYWQTPADNIQKVLFNSKRDHLDLNLGVLCFQAMSSEPFTTAETISPQANIAEGWHSEGYGDLRPGGTLRIEQEIRTSSLTLSALLDQPLNYQLSTSKEMLSTYPSQNPEKSNTMTKLSSEELLLCVEFEGVSHQLLLDSKAKPQPSHWKKQVGIGDWSVYQAKIQQHRQNETEQTPKRLSYTS